jgi:hypothetical protein
LCFFKKALGVEGIGAFNLHVKNISETAPIVGKDCYGLLWNKEGEK